MKKWWILMLVMSLLLSGCAPNPTKTEDVDLYQMAWHGGYATLCYKDRLYVGTPLRYYDLATQEGPVLACVDPLCKHGSDCTSQMSGIDIFLLDGAESTLGEVFYTVEQYRETIIVGESEMTNPHKGYYIQRVDVSNGKKTTVLEDIPNRPVGLVSYKESLYYCSVDGDGKRNIHAVNKNGKNQRQLANGNDRQLFIIEIEGDVLYYCDNVGNFYKTDLSLSGEQFVHKMTVAPPLEGCQAYVRNGWLYYLDDLTIHTLSSGEDTVDCKEWTLYRFSLENGGVEKLEEHINSLLLLEEDVLYYQPYNPTYYGRVTIEDEAHYGSWQQDVLSIGQGTLIARDLEDGTTKTIVSEIGRNINSLFMVNEKRMLFDGTRYDYDVKETYKEPSASPVYCLDLLDGEIVAMDIYDIKTIMSLYNP